MLLPKDALRHDVGRRRGGDPHDGRQRRERDGIDIRTGHRVQRTIVDDNGAVVGVEADTADGKTVRLKARKAVIFATGGFTHDVELRKNFLSVPVFGGCAALTNEGDFVHIGSAAGAELRNMNYAWMCPIVLEKALNNDPTLIGTFSPSRRLDDLCRQDRPSRHQREARLQRIRRRPSSTGIRRSRNIRTWCWSRSGTSAARRIRPATNMAASSCRRRRRRHVIKGETLASSPTNIKTRVKKYASAHRQHEHRRRLRSNLEATIAALQRLRQGRQGPRFPAAASARSSCCSTAPPPRSPAGRTRPCTRSATAARTTRRC